MFFTIKWEINGNSNKEKQGSVLKSFLNNSQRE